MADILDPHTTSFADALYKAQGLADYAQKHGEQFGRIELIVMDNKAELRRLDLNKLEVRSKVRVVKDKPQLDQMYDELG